MCEHLATLVKRFLGIRVGPESQRSCQAPWWFWWSTPPGNSTSLWHIFSLQWYKRATYYQVISGWVWWCQGHWCPQLPPEVGLQTALWSHRSRCPPGGESPALWVLWPGEREREKTTGQCWTRQPLSFVFLGQGRHCRIISEAGGGCFPKPAHIYTARSDTRVGLGMCL